MNLDDDPLRRLTKPDDPSVALLNAAAAALGEHLEKHREELPRSIYSFYAPSLGGNLKVPASAADFYLTLYPRNPFVITGPPILHGAVRHRATGVRWRVHQIRINSLAHNFIHDADPRCVYCHKRKAEVEASGRWVCPGGEPKIT